MTRAALAAKAVELRNVMAKIMAVEPEKIWTDFGQFPRRHEFRSDPFKTFMISDTETQVKILGLAFQAGETSG